MSAAQDDGPCWVQELDLAALVERWRGPLIGFLLAQGLDRRTAVEVAQDAFAEAWLGIERFRGDPGSDRDMGAWLRGIARNRARMARRARRALPLEEVASTEVPAEPPPAEEHPLAAAVRAEVERLPEREREAVLATYFEAASAAVVAGLLGTSVRAVEGLLRRARGRLAARLGGRSGARSGARPGGLGEP